MASKYVRAHGRGVHFRFHAKVPGRVQRMRKTLTTATPSISARASPQKREFGCDTHPALTLPNAPPIVHCPIILGAAAAVPVCRPIFLKRAEPVETESALWYAVHVHLAWNGYRPRRGVGGARAELCVSAPENRMCKQFWQCTRAWGRSCLFCGQRRLVDTKMRLRP